MTETRPGEIAIAGVASGILALIFGWWAWKQGAYFGSVFLPGAMIVYVLVILLLFGAPFKARLRGPAGIALLALLALAAWTLFSILWTPSSNSAVQDFERAFLYATAFGLGIWTCVLAGRRFEVPLAVVAVAGAVVGIAVMITLGGGEDFRFYFHDDATLRFPIGYRNAEAAFMLICFWPTIVLAAEGRIPWQLRALAVGVGTALLELVVLAQSRGSLPAAAVGLLILLLVAPRRLRVAVYIALAAVPVLPVLPTLLDIFQHGSTDPDLVPLMRDSAKAIAISTVASIGLAAICIRGVEPRLTIGTARVRLISRVAAALAIGIVVAGSTVYVAKRGGPLDFVDQRVQEFKHAGNPDLRAQGTRFGVNVGSNRRDFWRVALDEGGDNPLRGGGAGAFSFAYLRQRESGESPNDPHSVEMLMWSELGGVGVLLFATFLTAAAIAALRARRLGRSAAALVAGALAAGGNWLFHASYDWFWHYPALTAPVIFLLGAAAAPSLLDRAAAASRRLRIAGACVLSVALLIAVPLFLSQRYADSGLDDYPDDPGSSLENLDRAADLDPFAPRPLLAKGLIELELGREREAAASFTEAIDREPEDYTGHYFLARALTRLDPETARAEADEALRLNPLDEQTRTLRRRLQPESPPGENG